MRHCAQSADAEEARPPARGQGSVQAPRSCRQAPHRPLAAVLLALMAVPSVLVFAADDTIETQQRGLADVERRVQDLEQDLGKRQARRDDLMGELEQRERNIAALARSGHQLAETIDAQEQAVRALRNRLTTEQEALRRERAALGNLLRSAYAMGRGDRVRMLLDQEDPSRFSRVMGYYGLLNRFRIQRIQAVTHRARELDSLARQAEEEKARLSLLARKQEETRTRLTTAQAERTALLASLEHSISTQAESITDLRAQAREMRLLLEQLERRARALPEAELRQEPLKKLRGRLGWPLADAPVLSHFGSPKGDGTQLWDGVVLGTEEGAEVRAVHDGRVVYADWLRGFGLLLIIEHDEEYMTLYGNNQTLLKEPGEWVAAGDVVALSGSSGGRQSPGLYFAIRHRGQPLNPERWCRNKVPLGPRSSASAPWQRNASGAPGSNFEDFRIYFAGTSL